MSGVLRADLHVHSYHSGYARHLRILRARDCYSAPEAVYAAARARGMDVVTITDDDSIDGCLEFLNRHPDAEDFFISEEVECSFPGTTLKAHSGAYAIDERIHREIQPLRSDVHDVVAYLRSRDVFYALNHPFFFFTGQMPFAEYVAMLVGLFPALEVRNGTMLPEHNLLAQAIVSACGAQGGPPFVMIGGSDAHTLARGARSASRLPHYRCRSSSARCWWRRSTSARRPRASARTAANGTRRPRRRQAPPRSLTSLPKANRRDRSARRGDRDRPDERARHDA